MRLAAVATIAITLAGCGEPAPAPSARPDAVTIKPAVSAPSPTLAAVRKRGWLSCGVHPGLAGFAYPDRRGAWRGFDVDICRAIAAAVLGDAAKVRFTPVTAEDRFTALKDGRIDVLSRNTSWTLSRDAEFDFPAVTYFDGQGFLAPKALSLASAEELGGARICVQANTVSEANLADYFRARGVEYRPVVVASEEAARAAYQDETCDVYTADISALASTRSILNSPNSHAILPDVISKEPLGPVVRQGDDGWAEVVRWTVYALILGEELGLTSKTVEAAKTTASDPQTRRLLGLEGDLGPKLGLSPDWAYQAILQVGAYHEVFRRDLGADSPLRLARGMNALWNAPQPGLLYAPPMR